MTSPVGQDRDLGGKLVAGASALVAAIALFGAGFLAGWFVFSGQLEGASGATEGTAPPSTAPRIPEGDVRGKDVSGLPRYPGSVRAEYERVDLGGFISTDAEYVTTEDAETVQEFYREVFETGGWEEADVGFEHGEFFYFVTRGEREAVVEVEPRAELVEVEIEVSEPDVGS